MFKLTFFIPLALSACEYFLWQFCCRIENSVVILFLLFNYASQYRFSFTRLMTHSIWLLSPILGRVLAIQTVLIAHISDKYYCRSYRCRDCYSLCQKQESKSQEKDHKRLCLWDVMRIWTYVRNIAPECKWFQTPWDHSLSLSQSIQLLRLWLSPVNHLFAWLSHLAFARLDARLWWAIDVWC